LIPGGRVQGAIAIVIDPVTLLRCTGPSLRVEVIAVNINAITVLVLVDKVTFIDRTIAVIVRTIAEFLSLWIRPLIVVIAVGQVAAALEAIAIFVIALVHQTITVVINEITAFPTSRIHRSVGVIAVLGRRVPISVAVPSLRSTTAQGHREQ
tara:strand:- start:414 stop:869 length:456 start_codon:yes stop_codon:yes gene_type:complete